MREFIIVALAVIIQAIIIWGLMQDGDTAEMRGVVIVPIHSTPFVTYGISLPLSKKGETNK